MGFEPTFCFRAGMRGYSERLQGIIEPTVAALGYELVGVQYLPGRRRSLLRVYIDNEQGITLDDCEKVSHQVEGILDVEDPIRGQYSLEVSSPGLDRPLFTARHFERFVGSRVRVRMEMPLEGRRNFTGEIRACRDGAVTVLEDGLEQVIPLARIGVARLIPDE